MFEIIGLVQVDQVDHVFWGVSSGTLFCVAGTASPSIGRGVGWDFLLLSYNNNRKYMDYLDWLDRSNKISHFRSPGKINQSKHRLDCEPNGPMTPRPSCGGRRSGEAFIKERAAIAAAGLEQARRGRSPVFLYRESPDRENTGILLRFYH